MVFILMSLGDIMRIINYSDPSSLAYRFRRKRMRWLKELIQFVLKATKTHELSICDLGGTAAYWQIFPFHDFAEVVFRVDLYNLDYPDYDEVVQLPKNVSVRKLIGDARSLKGVRDKEYHIAHSNSVIEHVGGWQDIESMAREMRRVGQYYYVQTPNYWFPVESHWLIPFYQFFPRPMRISLQMLKGAEFSEAIRRDESIRLLTRKEMRYLFPDGEMLIERFFGFLPKSIVMRSPCHRVR